ncbi:MAG: ABC transporter ATP-binding protein [Eubacteriales bacterium]|nr:ABC transporter ATP-binding protein [Eubacteriales bacterium]
MDVLELSHVSKRFGSQQVLADLSLHVPEHTIYGFIGENGAGKTTTMKLILGLLARDGGEIRVCGEPVRYGQTRTNRSIGYLPDVPEFYGYLTPAEYLALCGGIAGVPACVIRERSDELLSLVGLSSAVNRRIGGFSRGMKQRLGIAQALIHRPKLLICDEPTSALDPAGRKEIIDILNRIKQETTVLFSTHILPDIERVCDEIGLLHGGVMALEGRLEEIRQLHAQSGFSIEFLEEEDAALFQAAFPGAERDAATRLVYPKGTQEDMLQAMKLLGGLNLCPVKMERTEPSLESLFLEAANA